MKYVYHMVPKEMRGETLISLNALEKIDTELYESYASKYYDHPDRIKLLSRRIPKLNCLWNDVIFLLPLHPYHVFDALNSIGIRVKKNLMFYEIPADRLNENINAVYFYRKEKDFGPAADIPNEEVELIDITLFEGCSSLPVDTLAYFKEGQKKGSRMGMFVYIPHIMSLGSIKVKDVNVINWSVRPNHLL